LVSSKTSTQRLSKWLKQPSESARSHEIGCETFGDLGWGDRHHTLQRLVGRVKYVKEKVIGFSKVALYNYSLQRMDETHG
jgi:hypothetical protein